MLERRLAIGVLLLAPLLGCSPIMSADAGYMDTFSEREGRTGVAASLRFGVYNPTDPSAKHGGGPAVGGTFGFRLKFTEQPNEGYWMALGGIGFGGPAWYPPTYQDPAGPPATIRAE